MVKREISLSTCTDDVSGRLDNLGRGKYKENRATTKNTRLSQCTQMKSLVLIKNWGFVCLRYGSLILTLYATFLFPCL